MPDRDLRKVELTIAWATIFKVLAAALLAYVAVKLWPLSELLFLALLIALTFWPGKVRARRWAMCWAESTLLA